MLEYCDIIITEHLYFKNQEVYYYEEKILSVVLGLALCFGMTGCASWDRAVTDIKSDVNGGMQRTITVYTADGKELATYEGKN